MLWSFCLLVWAKSSLTITQLYHPYPSLHLCLAFKACLAPWHQHGRDISNRCFWESAFHSYSVQTAIRSNCSCSGLRVGGTKSRIALGQPLVLREEQFKEGMQLHGMVAGSAGQQCAHCSNNTSQCFLLSLVTWNQSINLVLTSSSYWVSECHVWWCRCPCTYWPKLAPTMIVGVFQWGPVLTKHVLKHVPSLR